MHPIDQSDAHLRDRAVEFRAVKSLVVVLAVTLAAVFYPWQPVVAVFAVGYVAYQYRYYRNRIGVYSSEDRSVRQDRLEYGLFGLGVAVAGTLLAIGAVFREEWTLGGFLSLPAVDFTDLQALLEEPMLPLAWLVALAPAVAASYVGLQFRKRLLAGVDSDDAAVRATVWDALARLPIVLLWFAVLGVGPVFDIWRPVVEEVATQLDLTTELAPEFSVVLGEAFGPVVVGSIAATAAVTGAYLGVQRRKYLDATVPEVLGYRGLAPPSRAAHRMNVVVPAGVLLLYAAGILTAVGTGPLDEQRLLVAVGVSALVGANLFARTTTTVERASEWTAERLDAVVVGLVVGAAGLVALGPVVGADAPVSELLLSYPVVAAPATYAGNRLAGEYESRSLAAYADRVAADWNAFDEATTDRLFVHSGARDPSLRATAIDALASSVQASTYRKDDALDVFAEALASDDGAVVRSGLRGLATVLSYDQSPATYDRLTAAGVTDQVTPWLDSGDGHARSLAAETLARLNALETTATGTVPAERLSPDHVRELREVVEANPEHWPLRSAVVEYFATLWYEGVHGAERDPTAPGTQALLGSLLTLSATGEQVSTTAAFAVTGARADADETRFSLALDHLDGDQVATRYLAAHLVRSSLDRHAGSVDPDRVLALLEDPSPAVRWMGAEAVATLLRFDPSRGPELRDRLVLHLEENRDAPGRPESAVLRALAGMDEEHLVSHPTAATTIAAYVDDGAGAAAQPAAEVLTALVEASRSIARQEPVRDAVEHGLTHDEPAVRRACLDATVAIVEDAGEAGRAFVDGLAANLDAEGERGVLAAVALARIVEAVPEAGPGITAGLVRGLRNHTPVDRQSVPFMVRGGTVSAVTVDIVADAVATDPGRAEALIEPLVDLATTAERSTLAGIFRVLADLSAEFPDTAKAAVESAAVAIEQNRVSTRRDAAQVLANVAAYHPDAVAPFVDRLVLATDDDSPRVRAAALVALRNVCAALPGAVESDIHRIVGRLDDDSSVVRKHAARLIATVADREPELIEPAAETSDRLRRLQRDPAVDVDAERLQTASTAIQTGVSATDIEDKPTNQEKSEIWTPESADEMGVSGDTEVFEPVGDDFDPSFDEEIEEELDTEIDEPVDESATQDSPLAVEDETPPTAEDENDDLGDQETVIEDESTAEESPGDLGDHDTVIEDDSEGESGDGLGGHDTIIKDDGDDESSDDLGDHDTVIEGGSDNQPGDLGDRATVIDDGTDDDGGEDGADERDGPDIEDHTTVIEPDGSESDDEDAR